MNTNGPGADWVVIILALTIAIFGTIAYCSGNSDSIKSCASACGGAMASYTEAKIPLSGELFRIVPVCTCATK